MSTQYDHVIEYLKDNEIRVTPQRQAIIRFLIESQEHPTASEIYECLQGEYSTMSFATVYNTLNLLKEHGLVKEIKMDDSTSRFDFFGDEHYHIMCDRCGRIVDVYYPIFDNVDDEIEKLTGFKISTHNLRINGLCPVCQGELQAEKIHNS